MFSRFTTNVTFVDPWMCEKQQAAFLQVFVLIHLQHNYGG